MPLSPSSMENQTQLEAMRNELAKAQPATEQATDAEAQLAQTQSALDQANKEIEQLRTQLEQQQKIQGKAE